jgi:hypothetical protein
VTPAIVMPVLFQPVEKAVAIQKRIFTLLVEMKHKLLVVVLAVVVLVVRLVVEVVAVVLVLDVVVVTLVVDVMVVVIKVESAGKKRANFNEDQTVFRKKEHIPIVVVFMLVEFDNCQNVIRTAKPIPQINDPSKSPVTIGEPNETILLLVLKYHSNNSILYH